MAAPRSALAWMLGMAFAAGAAAGETDPVGAYESRLKAALAAGTVEAILPLVQLPLRVNGANDAAISIENEAALEARYAEVFPASWQARVQAAGYGERIA